MGGWIEENKETYLSVHKIDIIQVQDTTVSIRKEAWLERSLALSNGFLKVNRAQEAVFHHTNWNFHEGSGHDFSL